MQVSDYRLQQDDQGGPQPPPPPGWKEPAKEGEDEDTEK